MSGRSGLRNWSRWLPAGAFPAGALATVCVHQLAQSPNYLAVVGLVVVFIAPIPPVVIARPDIHLAGIGRIGGSAAAGIAVTTLIYLAVALASSAPDLSALSHIEPASRGSNEVICTVSAGCSDAQFMVTVPAGYTALSVSFTVRDAPPASYDCTSGSMVDVTATFGSTPQTPLPQPAGTLIPIQIPPAVSSFRLSVHFTPQPGFDYCDEEIFVASGHFSP
jgi:hypothetical protein